MDSVKPRRGYHSPEREARANETRRRILDAAGELFTELGFANVTMQAISQRAGVALATLYLHFPGRSAVVEAMAEAVAASPDLSVDRVIQQPTTEERMRVGAGIMRALNERSWVVADILRSLAGSEDEMARLWERWRERHLAAVGRTAQALGQAGALREDLTAEEATDILYALAGTEVYRALVRERGWTNDHYEAWLFQAARRELLR